jgi:phosphatidylglycerol:prolipoprotein diacylglycerol transferase
MPLDFLFFLAIDINIDPTMFEAGPFTLTWHGFFTAVGIIFGVSLSVWLCKKDGIPSEIAQEVALVAVPSAIVGARLFYVFEHWGDFSGDPITIITDITEGGITLYGGLIGGVLGGLAYGFWRKLPIAITLDAAAPGMILGQGIGRIGDLINGEHHADPTSLPWAFRYIHPNTLGELGVAVHPTAGGYELLGDFIICALLVFVFRRIIKTPGWIFCTYIGLYGAMRFGLSYTRTDEATLWDVPIPQLVAAVTVGLAFILAPIVSRWPGPITREWAERVLGEDTDDTASPPDSKPATA